MATEAQHEITTMIVSDARREANRRNALKSTGPRSAEGKETARQNALKHGLSAIVVRDEDAEAVQNLAEGFAAAHRPQNEWQVWLCEEMAHLALKIDRVEDLERKAREKASWRAFNFWDDDRRLAVENLASGIRKDPARVVAELRMTPQGCDWLIERWVMLAAIADRHPWTAEQKTLAYNMLGTPAEAREGEFGATTFESGSLLKASRFEADVARDMIVSLRLQRDRAKEADEIDRALTQADLNDEANPELRRLRRYELALHRQLRWTMNQFSLKQTDANLTAFAKPNFENPTSATDPSREPSPGDRSCSQPSNEARDDLTCVPTEWTPVPPATPILQVDKTKPHSDETKPISDETKPISGKTKPFDEVESVLGLMERADFCEPIDDYDPETGWGGTIGSQIRYEPLNLWVGKAPKT